MIPLGGKLAKAISNHIDPEPFDPKRTEPHQKQEVGRNPISKRFCNQIDIGFRNEAGVPLSVYWANSVRDVPPTGFTCAEEYQFHMGVKAATQDFMLDWGSKTKYEGSFIGHTFIARRADNPNVVVDSYTLEPTRIIDCPNNKKKQIVQLPAQLELGEDVGDGEDIGEDGEEDDDEEDNSCPNGDGDGDGEDDADNTVFLPPDLPPRPGATGFGGVS